MTYEQRVRTIWDKLPNAKHFSFAYDMDTFECMIGKKEVVSAKEPFLVLNYGNAEIQVTEEKTIFCFPNREIEVQDEDDLQLCLRKLSLFLRLRKITG